MAAGRFEHGLAGRRVPFHGGRKARIKVRVAPGDFEELDGRLRFDFFAELAPTIGFELDTYWASNFGANDAVELVKRYGERCPLLHIKDGMLDPKQALVAVGSGKMDIPGVIKAASDVTQWLIVEQDDSDTDMFECVESSYHYLVDNGLAEGNR